LTDRFRKASVFVEIAAFPASIRPEMIRTSLIGLALLATATAARADTPEGIRYGAWQVCLRQSFDERAALSGRGLAADAALRECRDSEGAYLAALSASPLLDGEDVSRARPALLARARIWLLGQAGTREL